MTTNNSNNISETGIVYHDGSGTFTGVNQAAGDFLIGSTGNEPNVVRGSCMAGNNCTFYNLSFTLSGGVVTIAGSDGTALSSSNPGYIVMPSNVTVGRQVTYKITANQTLDENDLDGNLGYTTSGDNLTNPFPLYVGFMADSSDTNLTGVVTWLPSVTAAPSSSANIGDPSAANADKTYSVFAFDDITEANYTSSAVGLIGCIEATKDGSNLYTIQALNNLHNGVGRWGNRQNYSWDQGQYGAASSSIIINNGGTAPAFGNGGVAYLFNRDGLATTFYSAGTDGGRDGSGNVGANLPLTFETDYKKYSASNFDMIGPGRILTGNETSLSVAALLSTTNFHQQSDASGNVQNSDYTNGARIAKYRVEFMPLSYS